MKIEKYTEEIRHEITSEHVQKIREMDEEQQKQDDARKNYRQLLKDFIAHIIRVSDKETLIQYLNTDEQFTLDQVFTIEDILEEVETETAEGAAA